MILHNLVESIEPRGDGKVYAVVVYFSDDSTVKIREESVINPPIPSTLITLVNNRTAAIQSQIVDPTGLKALLALKGTEIVPPIPPNPVDPTPEQIAKQKWLALVNNMSRAVVLSVDHPYRVDLQKQIDDTFDKAFIEL